MRLPPRAVWLPWLLLLVPTAVIGVAALVMLRQEQRRLATQSAAVVEAAAAATRTRAQVAAENIELFVGEVRDGLLRELQETPPEQLPALLANWPATNPLVGATLRWDGGARDLVWPQAGTPAHAALQSRYAGWLAGTAGALDSAEGKALAAVPITRGASFGAVLPPLPASAPALAADQSGAVSYGQREEAAAAFNNIAVEQQRGLRQQVQELARSSADAAKRREATPAVSSRVLSQVAAPAAEADADVAARGNEGAAADESFAADASTVLGEARTPFAASANAGAPPPLLSLPSPLEAEARAKPASKSGADAPSFEAEATLAKEAPSTMATESAAVAVAVAGRERAAVAFDPAPEGWLVRDAADGRRYFLGWRRLAGGGDLVAVELALEAVLERVTALVPPAVEAGERFALQRAGASPPVARTSFSKTSYEASPDFRVPLATTLPGWELAAWQGAGGAAEEGGAQAFFVVGALLVVIFAAAIGTGGWMFFQQARAAEREATQKTSFVANVSHEMKTPLTTLRMYAELLAEGRVTDETKRRRYLETIGRETTRLARLVNNVLEFSRLDAGRKEYRHERVPLATALERLAEMQSARAAEAGVTLHFAPVPEEATVQADSDALEQVLLNLCDNALKYGAAGGEVAVQVARADRAMGGDVPRSRVEPTARGAAAWAVVVADRGPGVPPAQREWIFERFHRGDDSLTTRVQGVGLGLTIARRLARDQGGDLVCRERSGGGAEFVLTLPAA